MPQNKWLKKFVPTLAALLAVLPVAGCATYHDRPLTRRGVRRRLAAPTWKALEADAKKIPHADLPPVRLRPKRGLTPGEAALIAVLINPALRAQRARMALGRAQIIQAGILPNPQLTSNMDFVTGGNTLGTYTAYGIGLSWNIRQLLTRRARLASARAGSRQINLDIAWREWLVAQAARQDVYNLAAAQMELARALRIARRLRANYLLVRRAVRIGQMTALDLAAADTASQVATGRVLRFRQVVAENLVALRAILGLPPNAKIRVRKDLNLPSHVTLPPEESLLRGVTARRLDFLALKQGYQSAQEQLRAAVLAQFPQVNVGFAQGSDNTNVHSAGFGVTVDLPICDRNQGYIARDQATRRILYDDYVARVFGARAAIARAYVNIRGLNAQIRASGRAIPALRNLVNTYRVALNHGNVDVLSYYTARINLESSGIALIRLKGLLADNLIALDLAAGEYLAPRTVKSPRRVADTMELHK